jgi:hypothetical protein
LVNRPCFNVARRMRSIPSAVFGPVLSLGNPGQDERDSGMMSNGVPG